MSQSDLDNTLNEIKELKQELSEILNQTKTAKQELETVLGFAGSLVKYGAVCYTQTKLSNTANGEFVIRYPYSELPNNGLLFMVPQFSSITYQPGHYNKLILKYPQTKADGTTSYTGTKTYSMIKEDSNGTHSAVTKGDIIANRLAIFRFISGDNNTVILVNNPQYNNLQVSSLHVTNNVSFENIPSVAKEDNTYVQLATTEEVLNLENRVKALEGKFLYGLADAEDALYNAPEGTIYIKIEEN